MKVLQSGERNIPLTCLQCGDAACMKACEVGAISRDETSDALLVDLDRCIGCRTCMFACPFGHMSFDESAGKAFKCDLCGGQPACAMFCPEKAITFE